MGIIFVTIAPSGGGKTTINKKILDLFSELHLSISYTSRKPRSGDKEGVDYFFISEEKFKEKIKAGDFIEYAVVHACYYGTSISKLKELRAKGDVLLEIDVQGANQIKKHFPEAVMIFILPPDYPTLVQRLTSRATETKLQIKLRLEGAKKELEQACNYDYIVVNDSLELAVERLKSIICAEKLRLVNMKQFLDKFMKTVN